MLLPRLVAALCLQLLAFPAVAQTLAPPLVSVVQANEQNFTRSITVTGTIVAQNEVAVVPLLSGLPILSLHANEGDHIEQGALLAELSQEDFSIKRQQLSARKLAQNATIAQAEASLVEARSAAQEAARVAERSSALAESGNLAEANAESARSAQEAANARLRAAEQGIAAAHAQAAALQAEEAALELDASRANIHAPVSGTILTRAGQIGALTSPTAAPLFTIAAANAFELALPLTASDLAALKIGQSIALPDGKMAKLVTLPAALDAQSKLGIARFSLEGVWRKGESLTVTLPLLERRGQALPRSAVLYEGGAHVMLVEDGAAKRLPVETGLTQNGYIEILSPIPPEAQIVARAGGFLRDGDRISPAEVTE